MEPAATASDGIAALSLADKQSTDSTAAAVPTEQAEDTAAPSTSSEIAQPAGEVVSKQQQVQPTPTSTHILDPAIKQALIDSNRDTVLKLEETVLEFMADSSKTSLEFPGSTSNYERLLQHKVAQHHLLQTSTVMVTGTPRVLAKRPDKPLGAAKSSSKAAAEVPKLSSIDVSTIKVEPKTLIRRPPSANSMRGADGAANQQQQQQQQQCKKTHKEREADYHEARERLLGNSLSHGSGSTGNLAAPAASNGSRPGSAGANRPAATAGAGYLAAVPPIAGERGFNIGAQGRGAGRGGGAAPGRGATGGRGAGANGSSAVDAADGAAAAAGEQQQQQGAPAARQQQKQPQQQQQQQRRQQQQQQQQQQQGGRGAKAVYKDRQRDTQDPDYARGVDRFQPRFDPGYAGPQGNMYNVPTYGSEFPSLGGPNGSPAGKQQQHSRTGSAGNNNNNNGSSNAAANGAAAAANGGFQRSGSAGNIPAGQQQQQQQQGSSSRAQQRHQQYQAAQQQQQMTAGGAPWGYYPPNPADPTAAAAMYNQMAAAAAGGQWGYGVPMDPSMGGYPYGAYGGWGWGMQGGVAAYPAGGYAGQPSYGMPPQYGGQQQQQQQQQQGGGGGRGGGGRGGGKGGNSSKSPAATAAADADKQ